MIALPRETRVLVKAGAGRGQLVLETQPVPPLGPHDALVKLHHAGICGTDLHLYGWDDWAARNYRPPVRLGHEIGGEVVATGAAVTRVAPGDRVSAETHLSCGICAQCRANRRHTCLNLRLFSKMGLGGFCDFSVVPEALLRPMSTNLPFRTVSVLEPLGIGLRLAMEADIAGKTALVCGCGPVGLFAIAAAKALGAARVIATDIEPYRLALAGRVGADLVIDVGRTALAEGLPESDRDMITVAIEASGNENAIRDALAVLTPGSIMLLAGLPKAPLPIDLGRFIVKEIRLQGIYGRLIDETWIAAERLLQLGQLDVEPILTHSFPLAEFEEAFRLAASGKAGKVLFDFS